MLVSNIIPQKNLKHLHDGLTRHEQFHDIKQQLIDHHLQRHSVHLDVHKFYQSKNSDKINNDYNCNFYPYLFIVTNKAKSLTKNIAYCFHLIGIFSLSERCNS